MADLYEYYNTGDDDIGDCYGIYWRGQTFTPAATHKITSVKLLWFRIGSPGTITVSIKATDGSGLPTGEDLCSGTTNGNTLPTGAPYEWREITLGSGCFLYENTKYAIVWRALDGDLNNRLRMRADSSSPTYAGGSSLHSSNSGVDWSANTAWDSMFEEWGIASSTTDYYFDSFLDTVQTRWTAYPERMVDNILTNYAFTSLDGDIELVDENTCPGTDLGSIGRVEIRVYGYGDGDDRIDLWVKGGFIGDEHQLTMPSTAGWSAYADITTDTNAPSPWTWADVVALDVDVEKDTVGKGNTMYCAKVEIRVTYTPTGPPEEVTQYLSGNDCPVFPHEMDLVSDKLPCPPPHD